MTDTPTSPSLEDVGRALVRWRVTLQAGLYDKAPALLNEASALADAWFADTYDPRENPARWGLTNVQVETQEPPPYLNPKVVQRD